MASRSREHARAKILHLVPSKSPLRQEFARMLRFSAKSCRVWSSKRHFGEAVLAGSVLFHFRVAVGKIVCDDPPMAVRASWISLI